MTIIGSAYVEIRALDTNLRRDIDNAMKKIKDVTLNIKADVNLAPVRTKISELRAEIRSNPLKFETEVDDSKIIASLAEAHQLYKDNPLQVESHTDTSQMETALQTISERFRNMDSSVTPHANTARAEAEIAALDRRRTINVPIHANTALARAEIDTLTRRRSMTVNAKMNFLDADVKKALNALAYTMMGAVPAPAIKAGIIGVLSNIEQLSVGAAKMSTIVGSAGSSLLTLGANAFSIVGDLSSVVKIAAVAPAAFSGLAVSLVGAKIAWKNFAGAFSSNAKTAAKALSALPVEAQTAVKSMKGLWTEITKPAQKAFWVEMGTSLQDTVKNIVPAAKDGFVAVEVSLAKMTKGALASFDNLKNSGGMDTLFNNIAKGLDNASRAVTPFFDAINRLSVTGSKFLPIFGDYLAKSADKFNAFITKADEAGKIDVWIKTAVANLKDMGNVLNSSGDIIKGLVTISDMSGGKGLGQMADGMKRIADYVNGEPFRSRLVFVLEGARAGAEALGDGFGKIMDILGRSTISLRNFLKMAGEIGGSFMNNISKMFDGTGLGDGFQIFLVGVKNAMDNLGPTFSNAGKLMGDFYKIAGTVVENMAPGLNNLFDTLGKVMDKLVEGIIKVIPIFNDFVQNVLVIAAPIAVAVADAIGRILSAFADLPGQIQGAILIFGLLLLAVAKFKSLLADTAKGEMSAFKQKLVGIRDGFRDFLAPVGQSFARIGDGFATAGVAAGYAKDAIGKSFGEIRDSVKLTGMYIGDGFKTSMAQASGAFKNSSFVAGAKEFGRLLKDALLPGEVQDGFNRLGAKIENSMRDAVGKSLNAMDKLKEGVKNVFPPGQFIPALKELPKEVGGIIGDAAVKVTDSAKDMAGKVYDHSIYASKHLSDIGKGFQTAAADIKAGTAAVGSDLRAMGAGAVNAFNGTVLAAAIHPLTGPFVEMAAAAKTAFSTTTSLAGKAFSAVSDATKTAFNAVSTEIGKSLSGMAVAGSIQAGVLKDKLSTAAAEVSRTVTTAADGVRSYAGDVSQSLRAVASPLTGAFRDAAADIARVNTGLKGAFSDLGTHIATTARTAGSAMSSTLGSAVSNLKNNFAPAGAAIRDTFSGLAGHLAPAGTAIRELGTASAVAMGQVGLAAGQGLKGAATGLLSALGGPWGIGIAAATTAVALFAQTQAESKARVEEFTKVLDQQSGAMTGAAKNLAIKGLFDGVTNDFDNLVRGVFQNSKSVSETLSALGIDVKKYSDTMADDEGRSKLIDGMSKVSFALKHGQEVSSEMADSIGMDKKVLDGLSFDDKQKLGDSLEHARVKAQGMSDELHRAQDVVKTLAAATGTSTVEAQILSKNYETLASTTSTASAKFSALKENLDLLNRSSATNANQYKVSVSADKEYQQTLANTKTALDEVIKKNDGLVGNLYSVGKGFDLTSQAGRDLHTALDGQSDAILKIGTAAMDQALKAGKSTTEANSIAIQAMAPGVANLRETMAKIGLSQPQIDAIIKSFGLMPDQIATAISVTGTEEAQRKIFLTKLAADSFANGNYKAVLAALPSEAKKAIADATGTADDFATGNYDAILKALDKTAAGKEGALASVLSVSNGDYKAAIKALDSTYAGRADAENALRATANAAYVAQLKAAADHGSIKLASSFIDSAAYDRTAVIHLVADAESVKSANDYIKVAGGKYADGGLVNGAGKQFFANGGFSLPNVKAFANGSENHVAQISRGQTPFRVWSEPESGGEAYIPLSPAKRPRSLKILEEVAKMFGFSLYQQFANGGLSGFNTGPKTSGVSTGVSALATSTAYSTAAPGSNAPSIMLQVNPSAALDEEKVGKIAASELYWQFVNR